MIGTAATYADIEIEPHGLVTRDGPGCQAGQLARATRAAVAKFVTLTTLGG